MYFKGILWIPFLILLLCQSVVSTKKMKVLLFLIDGCRWDYINDPNLKGIPDMFRNGVRAPYVTPVFPSNSYPNWYSIVTGLYSENHGFVNNYMYDKERDEFFLMFPRQNYTKTFWWNEAEPIWITAEKNDMRSGVYWWVGCEATIRGYVSAECEPHRYGPGNQKETQEIVDTVNVILEEFKNGAKSLALVYYGSVDYNGHFSGPDSDARKKALYDIDSVLDKVQKMIAEKQLENEVNTIVVSDHGMTKSGSEDVTYIDLEPFAKIIQYQLAFGSSSMIEPEPGMLDVLHSKLIEANIKGLHVYLKNELPNEYHIKNNNRVMAIFLQADQGYFINPLDDTKKSKYERNNTYLGFHGYDPYVVEDMRTIFFARGPALKKGYVSRPLENVDHYNLMCHMLGIDPLPNNGSWDRIKGMLTDYNSSTSNKVCFYIFIFCFFLQLLLI